MELVRRVPLAHSLDPEGPPLVTREWLVTNGLGGYASGTVSGVTTRRFHGFLVAALPAPLGRTMMLNRLTQRFRLPGGAVVWIGGEEQVGKPLELHGLEHLSEFRLESGLPVWQYRFGDLVIERRIVLPHLQNTVLISYHMVEGRGVVRLSLGPAVHFRPHEAPVSEPLDAPYRVVAQDNRYELLAGSRFPPLRLLMVGERSAFTLKGKRISEVLYRVEESRGYEAAGDLWTPGYFRVDISHETPAALVASTEGWDTIGALTPSEAHEAEIARRARLLAAAAPAARETAAAELVLAADQFIITPAGRVEEAARAHAVGDEVRTVIAGYHWFTDWGRDTMISLEGLTLVTGRYLEAGYILRTFAHYVRDGLIPNMFPEGEKEGLYHTADATLWFFHALDRYVTATGDRHTLARVLPRLVDIVQHHINGTRFGIGVDPDDGLLRQGAEGYQLTWMDAKVDDWVVTPRRGKAVEINALWYNALCLLADWLDDVDAASLDDARASLLDDARASRPEDTPPTAPSLARTLRARAARVGESFNRRFWYEPGRHLYDVIDGEAGDDAACRPNQLLSLTLRHPVLDQQRWRSVVEVVRERLLTPVGLRSLAPGHPDYKAKYYGDLRARDAAYHQGTVWAWLIGPFIDAWLRVYPDDAAGARRFLDGFLSHLDEAGIGSISEVFDAEPPYTARGCAAQAWSVAEILRSWVKTAARAEEKPSLNQQLAAASQP